MKITRRPNGDKIFKVEPVDVLFFTGAVAFASLIQAGVWALLFRI